MQNYNNLITKGPYGITETKQTNYRQHALG